MPLAPMMTHKRFIDTAEPIVVSVEGCEEPVKLAPYYDLTGCGWKGSIGTIAKIDGQNQRVTIKVSVSCACSKAWPYS